MGRRDAVQVTLEVVARMRQILPSLVVSYEPGWETRGNGTSANYEGGLVHHTASASSLARPFPTQTVLRQGRSDLPGPLCNFAGPACTTDTPRLHVMACNPANHAGASGGRSMGPLPTTSLFNPRVLGLEIDYAGSVPMLAGQLLVAQVWSRAVADVVGDGDIGRVRAHYETSVTGKWDIGAGAGSVDMGAFRRDAATITAPAAVDPLPLTKEHDMFIVTSGIGSTLIVGDRTINMGSGENVAGTSGVPVCKTTPDLHRRILEQGPSAGLPLAVDARALGNWMLTGGKYVPVEQGVMDQLVAQGAAIVRLTPDQHAAWVRNFGVPAMA